MEKNYKRVLLVEDNSGDTRGILKPQKRLPYGKAFLEDK